jgi:2-polyprenyl-3-methyl-5-hydroxy-6-metoxy-1,4-benzoquinol methylase
MSIYTLKRDRFSSHSIIADMIKMFKQGYLPYRQCVVFDIGCNAGFLGNSLDRDNFYLIGLDKDEESVARTNHGYQEVIVADIEKMALPQILKQPDIVVLADVLEHCREPEQVLMWLLQKVIGRDAKVIICLPNIANVYVRLSLLLGHFNYTDRGILDRTHLRFFTLKTGLEMCRRSGLYVEALRVTPIPLPLIHPFFPEGGLLSFAHSLNARMTTVWKSLLSYQFIIYGRYRG